MAVTGESSVLGSLVSSALSAAVGHHSHYCLEPQTVVGSSMIAIVVFRCYCHAHIALPVIEQNKPNIGAMTTTENPRPYEHELRCVKRTLSFNRFLLFTSIAGCYSWCFSNTNEWGDKCTWVTCSECPECGGKSPHVHCCLGFQRVVGGAIIAGWHHHIHRDDTSRMEYRCCK